MNTLLQILASGGVASVIVVVVNAVANRRNLGAQVQRTDAETSRTDAETDQIITDSARGLVADLRVENSRKEKRIADLERRLQSLEDRDEDQRRTLILHAAWDHMAVTRLRDCDPTFNLPDPPPLTPPHRHRKS